MLYVNRPNVTAVWKAAAPGGHSLILNGHIDVVPVSSPELWSHAPWGGEIEGDWLYGRGAADMKGGIVAMLLAIQAIRSAGIELAGNVTIQSVIEEEATGNGSLACLLRGQRADTAIVPEPIQGIAAGVGIMWFRIRIQGPAEHIYGTYKSSNPIDKLIPIITGLRGLEAELNAQVTHPLYRQVEHLINLNFGIIRGGDWPSSTPTEVQIECRIGTEPGHTLAETQARVRSTVADVAQQDPYLREHPPMVEFFGCRAEPSVANAGGPATTLLSDINQEMGGKPVTLVPFTGNTDARFLVNHLGIEATCFGPVGERFHVRDERVSISSIKHVARVIALFILRWCKIAN